MMILWLPTNIHFKTILCIFRVSVFGRPTLQIKKEYPSNTFFKMNSQSSSGPSLLWRVALNYWFVRILLISVSHTTNDLIFTWDPNMPLDVDDGIELPQLELISTKHDDCTTVYSTGMTTVYISLEACKTNGFFYRQVHLPWGCVQVQASVGLLPLPHVRPDLSDCHHVVDQFLDQAGSGPSQGHSRGHQPPHSIHTARQLAKVTSSSLIHQGTVSLIFCLS